LSFRPAPISAAVRPAKLPSIQNFFYLVEREVVAPNGLGYIGLSVQTEPRALLAESEKEPGGQVSQAGLPVGISLLHYFPQVSMPPQSVNEVAQIVGIPEATVKTRIA
jgi:hypothetical protein